MIFTIGNNSVASHGWGCYYHNSTAGSTYTLYCGVAGSDTGYTYTIPLNVWQKYTFTLLGFLIDEDEFEITPAITRVFQIFETETKTRKKRQRKEEPNPPSVKRYDYPTGSTEVIEVFNYNVNLRFVDSDNVSSGTPPSGYEVYINGLYYGNDVREIQINSGDELKIVIYKEDPNETSFLIFNQELL
jgi:hypothetical protein